MQEKISVENLSLGYGERAILSGVSFELPQNTITVVMGGSGCGKSTLMKGMIGLLQPQEGKVFYNGDSLYDLELDPRAEKLRHIGVLYQGGALWSDRTVAENVAFPLEEFTELGAARIAEIVHYKLALVGLEGAEELYPNELSGGMRKRVALARAMALDPAVLFLDEPSAGLDPLNSRRLDELILQLKEGLGTSFVVITHELASIFRIAEHCLYLEGGKLTAEGTLEELKASSSSGAQKFLESHALPRQG